MVADVAHGLLVALMSSERAQTAAMNKRAKRRAQPKPKTPEKTFLERTWADMRPPRRVRVSSWQQPLPRHGRVGLRQHALVQRARVSRLHPRRQPGLQRRQVAFPARLGDARGRQGRQERPGGHQVTHARRHHRLELPGDSAADHATLFGEWEEGHTIFSDIGGNEGASGVVKADVNHRTYVHAFIHVEK